MTRILIVEDDEDFALILRRAIEQDPDLEVVDLISSYEEAIDYIKSPKLAQCDCVLLDLQLPKSPGDRTVNSLAGIQILEQLRHVYNFYKTVIVLTNSKAAADGERALAAGCDGYLCKRARIADVPSMLSELKMAIRGDVIIVAAQMRHVFLRDDISAKEARMLDLLALGKSWTEIAQELGYKTSKAAANIGDRVFDKLLSPQDLSSVAAEGGKKRLKAVEIWQSRKASSAK
ncbi:MAG: response regulator [Candidatus Obscuribacterales bacterium]|nr:response regulator [Candidatus Obscuribacterales bacterium]